MNKIEAELVKRAKKILYEVFLEEIEKQKNAFEKLETSKYYYDVLNSGILLDINKLKKYGLAHLEKQLKKRMV